MNLRNLMLAGVAALAFSLPAAAQVSSTTAPTGNDTGTGAVGSGSASSSDNGSSTGTASGSTMGSTGNGSMSSGSTSSSNVSQQDSNFVTIAAQSGLAEVQMGTLAEQKGGASVKKIGARMVADHTKANTKLKEIAEQLGLVVPASLSSADQETYTKLQGESGARFDSDYLAAQLTAHQQAISLFSQEAEQGKDAALRKFAARTLPVLKEHLSMIEAAQKQAGG
jgi:putative membrane protein